MTTAPWPSEATDPRDKMSRDELLLKWQEAKDAVEKAREFEMELRKYIVKRAFPTPKEGVNNLELGQGYTLKSTVKYNYNLKAPAGFDGTTADAIDDCIDKFIEILPNEGSFIADRLFSWKVDISVSEYKKLREEADYVESKKKLLDEVHKYLVISDATPTLEIKEPKNKK